MKKSLALAKQAVAATQAASDVAAVKIMLERIEAKVDKLLAGEKGKKKDAKEPAEVPAADEEVGA